MAVQVTNYKCPACTGPLQFDASTGKLTCEYCGSAFTVEEIEALYAEMDAETARNAAEAEQQPMDEATKWVMDDWGEDAENMRSYTCPSCGAALVCDATTAATACLLHHNEPEYHKDNQKTKAREHTHPPGRGVGERGFHFQAARFDLFLHAFAGIIFESGIAGHLYLNHRTIL